MVANDPSCPPPPFPPGDPRYEKADYLAQQIYERLSVLTKDATGRPGWSVVWAVFFALIAGFCLGKFS